MTRGGVRRGLRLGAALALVALAAGCGSSGSGGSSATDNGVSSKSADEIVTTALAAAKDANSVHIKAASLGGEQLAFDLHLVRDKGGAGHITTNGLTFDMVRVGDKAYFKGDADFWSHFGGQAAGQLFAGKWIVSSASTGKLASFTPLTDLPTLMTSTLSKHGTLEKGDTTTVAGQPAIAIKDTGSNGGTLYVATTGKPYPLKIVSEANGGGTLIFDRWDQSYTLTEPSDAVDLDKLGSGSS
jgi:hypothetical protein